MRRPKNRGDVANPSNLAGSRVTSECFFASGSRDDALRVRLFGFNGHESRHSAGRCKNFKQRGVPMSEEDFHFVYLTASRLNANSLCRGRKEITQRLAVCVNVGNFLDTTRAEVKTVFLGDFVRRAARRFDQGSR
ncbi:hypothetical protein EVAR_61980_1 [Eumeta japonica]|uniref:Uncharacterized protein n=1 Tax=Eumeta variegata TaxID=151549 RepID=A0A4C1YHL9_EUMVA|nr:hypothetical protein EVAR_61980_1 [Eumeta japonica]